MLMGRVVGVVELHKTRRKFIECQGGPLPRPNLSLYRIVDLEIYKILP